MNDEQQRQQRQAAARSPAQCSGCVRKKPLLFLWVLFLSYFVYAVRTILSVPFVTVTKPPIDDVPLFVLRTNSQDNKKDKNKNKNTITSRTESVPDSLSGCLLLMDENHRLPEWLAYHYYMARLRYVVVILDPRSKTSPAALLDRWRPYIQSEIWNDTDIDHVPDLTIKGGLERDYLRRQNRFITSCLLHLKKKLNKTWVTVTDVDEYLYLDPKYLHDAPDRMTKPDSVFHFLQQRKARRHHIPCFLVRRTAFGSSEENLTSIQQQISYLGLNATHFETIRFQHRAPHIAVLNGHPKSIVDLSSLSPNAITPKRWGIHTIMPSCRYNLMSPPVRVRHYLGSWEAFSSRHDFRVGTKRSRQHWEYYASFGKHLAPDTDVQSWVEGFANLVNNNISTIQNLLQGTGQLPPPSPELLQLNWDMTPEHIKYASNGEHDFADWLNQQYNITTLANGTVLATRVKT